MKFNFGRPLLETSKQGKIQRLGQDTFLFAEAPNFSQPPEASHGRPLTTTTTTAQQQSYTNTIDQQQQFHQPSYSIRPPPSTNYTTTPQLDNNNNTTTTMNFGPGWTAGLGRDRDERQRGSPLFDMEQGNQFGQKRHLDNKENTRIVKRKVEYNELV
ncbi:unnamed protein product [Absidia cylindrospora]